MTRQIIGLVSPSRSGKDTFAERLQMKHMAVNLKFAQPLKDMIATLLEHYNYTYDAINNMIEGDAKNEIIPEIGKTPVDLMKTLGTEWARVHVKEDLWVDIMRRKIQDSHHNVVVTDVSYQNEIDVIKEFGGTTVRVHRQEAQDNAGTHGSDHGRATLPVDIVIHNEGTIEELGDEADKLAERLYNEQK